MTFIFKYRGWGIIEEPKMRGWWGDLETSPVYFFLHAPCAKRAEAERFGGCFPAYYHTNADKDCHYCGRQTPPKVAAKLATVVRFIFP